MPEQVIWGKRFTWRVVLHSILSAVILFTVVFIIFWILLKDLKEGGHLLLRAGAFLWAIYCLLFLWGIVRRDWRSSRYLWAADGVSLSKKMHTGKTLLSVPWSSVLMIKTSRIPSRFSVQLVDEHGYIQRFSEQTLLKPRIADSPAEFLDYCGKHLEPEHFGRKAKPRKIPFKEDWWGHIKAFTVLSLEVLVLLLLFTTIVNKWADVKYDAAIRHAIAAGIPLGSRPESVPISPEQDATPLYASAFAEMDKTGWPQFIHEPHEIDLDSLVRDFCRLNTLAEADAFIQSHPEVSAYIDRQSEVMRLLEQATLLPQADFSTLDSEKPPRLTHGTFCYLMSANNLFNATARLCMVRRDFLGASHILGNHVRFERHIADPSYFFVWAHKAFVRQSIADVFQLLLTTNLNVEKYPEVPLHLDREGDSRFLRDALALDLKDREKILATWETDAAHTDTAHADPASIWYRPPSTTDNAIHWLIWHLTPARGFIQANRTLLINMIGAQILKQKIPLPSGLSAEYTEERGSDLIDEEQFPWYGVIAWMFSRYEPHHIIGAAVRWAEGIACYDMCGIAIACKRYEAAKGKLPASLDDLAAANLLSPIPVDPFGGQPYHYVLKDSGAVIYSVGMNFKDDGGTRGKYRPEGDIVFELTSRQP